MGEIEWYLTKHNDIMQAIENRIKKDGWEGTKTFIKDGIVSPNVWFQISQKEEKILFVLKEAYDKSTCSCEEKKEQIFCISDETKWLRHEQCAEVCKKKNDKKIDCINCAITGYTFNPIAEWVYGIDNIAKGEEKSYDNWLGVKGKKRAEYYLKRDELLQKIAVVNIKKEDGVSVSVKNNLNYYVEKYGDLLRDQIQIIAPTLIICGGTYDMLRTLFTELPNLDNSLCGVAMLNGSKVIATSHPNKRSSNKEKYDTVMELYKSLVDKHQ